MSKLDTFTRAYIECALWSSTVTVKDDTGSDLDINIDDCYSISDIAPETLAKMIADCAKFQADNEALLITAYSLYSLPSDGETTPENMGGHDFWLTRCGHGAGFWDRGLDDVGNKLTDACKAYGNVDLYVGGDGKIYA